MDGAGMIESFKELRNVLAVIAVFGIIVYGIYVMGQMFDLLIHATGLGAIAGFLILLLLSLGGLAVIIILVVFMWIVIKNAAR